MKRKLLRYTCLLGAGYLLLLMMGSPGGRGFFSPDTLESRSQSEILFRLPGMEIPLFRSSYSYHRHELVDYLVEKGYWAPTETSRPRWIMLFHWNKAWKDGESTFDRQFFWRKQFWMEWSEANPELASVLWPRVLEAIRSSREAQAVAMLVLAWDAHSKEEFEKAVSEAEADW